MVVKFPTFFKKIPFFAPGSQQTITYSLSQDRPKNTKTSNLQPSSCPKTGPKRAQNVSPRGSGAARSREKIAFLQNDYQYGILLLSIAIDFCHQKLRKIALVRLLQIDNIWLMTTQSTRGTCQIPILTSFWGFFSPKKVFWENLAIRNWKTKWK